MKLVPCKERTLLYTWQVSHRGIPEGFDNFAEYANYLDELFDCAGYEEHWYVNEEGKREAYVAWCIGMDAHRKGDIFDVTNIVVKPGSKCGPRLWREMVALARANGCQWISRCSHMEDGSMKYIYRRI